jgi:4-amino-4-deoxy-L-arabinose transferase-like glycosyltransferase
MSTLLLNRIETQKATRMDRWWLPLLLLILLVGAIIRLNALTLMEFRHDSAYWTLDAYRILDSGDWPLVGQQVGSVQVELYNGPIMSYITAVVFALFGHQPVRVAMLVATCNVVGILVTFLLGKRLYSRNVGLVAATLASLAPWLVLYGRMLWPQALFPCLIPTSLLVLLLAIENDKAIWYLLYGALLGIGLQLHLSVMALMGTGMLYVLIYSRRKWTVLLVVLGMVIGYAPILLYDVSHGFPNMTGLARLPSLHATEETRTFHFAKTLWNFANVLSGQALWVSKLSDSSYLPAFIDWGQGLLFNGLFLFALGMIASVNVRGRSLKQALQQLPYRDALLLLFVILPAAYLFVSRSLIQRHYFLFLYPAPFLIVARGLQLWTSRPAPKSLPQGITWVIPALLVIACTFNLITVCYAYNFMVESGGEGQYGTVLADKESAVDFILAHSEGNYEVNVESAHETLPFVFLFQARDGDILVQGREDAAISIRAASTRQPRQYRVVEPTYHDLSLAAGEETLYQSRGVIIVGQGE